MIKLAAWNIRGCNALIKREEVRTFIRVHGLSLCCIIESKVQQDNMVDVCGQMFGRWNWVSNAHDCNQGTRLLCAWNPSILSLMVLESSNQFLNCELKIVGNSEPMFVTFVYGCNKGVERRALWSGLRKFKVFIHNKAWIVLGDFNSMLFPHDGLGGSSRRNSDMEDFYACLEDVELFDLAYQGCQYTWIQKPSGEGGIMRKLDRILGNSAFIDRFRDTTVFFHPRGVSDHSPGVLSIKAGIRNRSRGFKFDNFLTNHDLFLSRVKEVWDTHRQGSYMKKVLVRLQDLKTVFRKLRNTYGCLDKRVLSLKEELDAAQLACDRDPCNVELKEDIAHILLAYQKARNDQLELARQKAKVKWLNEGDGNSKFFFHTVREKRNSSHISSVLDSSGVLFEGDDVAKAFISHFQAILGTSDPLVDPSLDGFVFDRRLSLAESLEVIRPITDKEIKDAIFDIGNDKAPGSDGYSSKFFKSAWSVVGRDVTVAVHNFFYSGNLEYRLNHTLLCLIPKSPNASCVSDFRPISCCNVLLKCISKIIADRMKGSLNSLVSKAQSAFIPGRQITDNILMAHELVAGYQKSEGEPRCAFKIDIRKAYDTVDWRYLIGMLQGMGFHPVMVNWINSLISSPSFSICVNGSSEGFFHGKRGLRQGDPISPYLFTIVMEGLSIILKRCIEEEANFAYHQGCEDLKLTHLCFADDLFIFSRGDLVSVEVIKRALQAFSMKSGLSPSLEKSEVFFGNVSGDVKNAILTCLPYRTGVFPIRYLGVPLSPVRLQVRDFNPLVVNLKNRLLNWKHKFLSYGGRRQLILSVLYSMQTFWMSVFLIPAATIHEIEQLCRDFLWNRLDGQMGKSRVSWEVVCSPVKYGGLGMKRLGMWNRCMLFKHIWDILTRRDSMWVRWIHSNCIKGRNFWVIKKRNEWSWLIRTLLDLRPQCRRFFISNVGDGVATHAWEDTWNEHGPLIQTISYRFINGHGFHNNSTVYDLMHQFGNSWPDDWITRYPQLQQVSIPNPVQKIDEILWLGPNQVRQYFSVKVAWKTLEVVGPLVYWYKVVWNKAFIPKHALCMWMACLRRLPTQDRLIQWKNEPPDLKCVFCKLVVESHNHLFFECSFSNRLWSIIKKEVGISTSPDTWDDILNMWMTGRWRSWSTVHRLAISATVYHIWLERNREYFDKQHQSIEAVAAIIKKEVLIRMAWKMTKRQEALNGV